MGCDIHMFVERREGGRWVTAEHWKEDNTFCIAHPEKEIYEGRDYAFFYILTGRVRPGRTNAVPIHPCKGIPADACPEVQRMAEQWKGIGHSHSWLTVAELLHYDWSVYQSEPFAGDYITGTFLPDLIKFGPPDDVRIVFFFDN